MSLLISRASSKWNNYYKRAQKKDPNSGRLLAETSDYILHLQQQIDALKMEVEELKHQPRINFSDYGNGLKHEQGLMDKEKQAGPILFCDPVGGGDQMRNGDKYYYQVKKRPEEASNDTNIQ